MEVACEDVSAERNRLEKQRMEAELQQNAGVNGVHGESTPLLLPESLAELDQESGSIVYPIVLSLVKDALVEIDKKNLTSSTLSALEAKANLLQRDCYLVFRYFSLGHLYFILSVTSAFNMGYEISVVHLY